MSVKSVEEVSAVVARRAEALGRPIVVGISGYGGSGKSTLARQLAAVLPDSVRMRGDDFLDPQRSHRRSSDWSGVERQRLVSEVLAPFREGRPGVFRRYDWSTRSLGEPEAVPRGRVLIVDAIGLFHPDALTELDVTIWCDVPLTTAQGRGMSRDASLGRDHELLWNEVWAPNERDFDRRFDPRSKAELLFSGPLA